MRWDKQTKPVDSQVRRKGKHRKEKLFFYFISLPLRLKLNIPWIYFDDSIMLLFSPASHWCRSPIIAINIEFACKFNLFPTLLMHFLISVSCIMSSCSWIFIIIAAEIGKTNFERENFGSNWDLPMSAALGDDVEQKTVLVPAETTEIFIKSQLCEYKMWNLNLNEFILKRKAFWRVYVTLVGKFWDWNLWPRSGNLNK